MKASEKIERIEDHIVGILVNWPDLVLTVPFDIAIFRKWRFVVEIMLKQFNDGVKPDILTITDAFPENKELLFNLSSLAKDSPGSSNYAHYLALLSDTVNDLSLFREVSQAVQRISSGENVKDTITAMMNRVMLSFIDAGKRKHDYKISEALQHVLDCIERNYQNRDTNIGKFNTGIPKLDRVVGHFQPTDLVIVGARPSIGKTAFAISLMLNMAKDGKKIGFISTEMALEQVMYRFLSQVSNIPAYKFRTSDFWDNEWPELSAATRIMDGFSLRINDKPDMKISEVIMQCRAWHMVESLDIVFIDYLTRIRPDKETQSRTNDVGEISAQLKNIARTLKVPVVCLAQLNRGNEKRADKTPVMSDLRDSGVIEQEADFILLLHREEDENLIIVEKNRHGESGIELMVDFDKPVMRWQ